MTHNGLQPVEELPGYTLIDRLGQGGYGEVWRASAPGGLMKAIKFVFGRQDGERAMRELRALERISSVRHPFLLSLERIEIVEGRLVVVTELADESLRDRLHKCIDNSLPGIPRDELLRILGEAADALDFLRDTHQLQHLDVKPENILLLSGHVKVADFGLVKSLEVKTTESLVGGMTPSYAAPEVFRGAPSRSSDQYSLAVLYQELLTGTLPFNGATTAELTLQHLNDEPDLSPLCEEDRYVLSRALTKEPSHRFDSCADFVRALAASPVAHIEIAPVAKGAAPAARRRHAAPVQATQVFDALDENAWNGPSAPILIDLEPPGRVQLAPIAPPFKDLEDFEASPTLFLGIGGASGRILRMLRHKMLGELGLEQPLAATQFLLLDTDRQALTVPTRGMGIPPSETLALPLKRPQQYREKASHLLGWLSRRWLYNIPRSGQTDGIRPLGRLALVDHARQTVQRIRHALTEASSSEAVEEAALTLGVPVRSDCVRVYVVASISGGAGSGMLYDVAYAIRSILDRMGIGGTSKVMGVLTFSTSREGSRGELSRVNAFSTLAELQHYNNPATAYPGEATCGLPAHPQGTPPFDSTYVLDFGSSPTDPQCVTSSNHIVDYLYLDSITPAQSWLDRCRAAEPDARKRTSVRSFRIEEKVNGARRRAASAACRALFTNWVGLAEEELPNDSDQNTNHLVIGAANFVSASRLDARGVLQAVQSSRGELGLSFDDSVARHEQHWSAEIGGWMAQKMDAPGDRLIGALRAACWLQDHLNVVLGELERQKPLSPSEPTPDSAPMAEEEHADLQSSLEVVRRLRASVDRMHQRIAEISHTLWLETVHAQPNEAEIPLPSGMLSELDQRLQDEYLVASGGVACVLVDVRLRAGLVQAAQRIAQGMLVGLENPTSSEAETVTQLPGAVTLEPSRFGGAERRITLSTANSVGAQGDSLCVVECEGLSIRHLAAHLVGQRQDYARLSDRVHARHDIDWKELLGANGGVQNDQGGSGSPLSKDPTSAIFDLVPTQLV